MFVADCGGVEWMFIGVGEFALVGTDACSYVYFSMSIGIGIEQERMHFS